MISRAALACIATLLSAVACQSDNVPTTPSRAYKATAVVVAPDAAPGTFTIFPSLVVTGQFGGNPVGYISVPSTSNVDRTFALTTDNPSVLPNLPPTVTVPAGANSMDAALVPITVSSITTVTVTLSGGGVSIPATLTAYPPGSTLPPPIIDTIFATPLTVTGGQPSTATIRLTSPAPAGGLVVTLFTKLPLSATMPPTVTFPAGATEERVPITTFPGFPNATTTVEIDAAALATIVHNGVNVVTGAVQQPLSIGATTFNAPLVNGVATVTGGTQVNATIPLTGPAPTGGSLVTLVSTDTTVATVPSSVVIPAGATSASFVVTTKTVTSQRSSNIGGTIGNGFVVSTLEVNPISTTVTPPPPTTAPATPSLLSPSADAQFTPGQSITFDWNDASGAASYTIQISTTDKFTSSVVNQTVSISQFTTSALPTSRFWWRVRSNSSSGMFSNYSSARRFEVK
jgi:hypothetical protein